MSKKDIPEENMEEWLSQENVYDSEGQRIHRYDTKIYVMPNEGGGEPAYSECEARDYIYQNGSLLSTEDISNSYTYFNLLTLGGNLIASSRPDEENNEKWYLYNKDDQGSTTSIIGEDGSAAAVYDYDEYGNTEVISGADFDNEIRYTGQMCDKSTGLYYYNARFYDPASGIFTSQDTYRGENSNPLTQNLYAYCAGDPVNNIDPTGHSWIGKKWKSFKAAVKKATKRSRTLNGSWSDHKTKKTVSGNQKHLNKKTKKYRKSLWKVIKRKTKAFTRIID